MKEPIVFKATAQYGDSARWVMKKGMTLRKFLKLLGIILIFFGALMIYRGITTSPDGMWEIVKDL